MNATHTSNAGTVRMIGSICLLCNLLLAAIKIAAGLAGNSQGVAADGVHTLSDALTDIVLVTGTLFWGRPPDQSHPYGHRRIETLVTGLIGAALLAAALGIGWQALQRLHEGPQAPPGMIALAAALLSIVVKEAMYRWASTAGRHLKSTALSANAWHQRSDALSSIPVAAAVAANRLAPSLWFLDSVAALLVAVLITKVAWDICRPALRELADEGADARQVQHITALAMQVAGVRQVHAVRTRSVAGSILVDLHVLVDPCLSVHEGHEIAREVERRLLDDGPDIVDALVHIEPDEPDHIPQ